MVLKRLFVITLLFLLLLLTGCSSKTTKTLPKELVPINDLAYNSLTETEKSTVKSKIGEVELYVINNPFEMIPKNKQESYTGKEVYRVIFRTTDEDVLGPIMIYIDKDKQEIIRIAPSD